MTAVTSHASRDRQWERLFRAPTAGDVGFLRDTWMDSARGSRVWADVPSDVYKREYGKVVASVLSRARVTIACNPRDPDQIFGYVVWEPSVVHYVYVKYGFRRDFIAYDLVAHVFPELGARPLVVSAQNKSLSGWKNTPASQRRGSPPGAFPSLCAKWNLTYDPFRVLGVRDADGS